MREYVCVVAVLAACGSKSPPVTTTEQPVARGPSDQQLAAERAHEDEVKKEQIVAAHRQLESEQQDALAVSCTRKAWVPPLPRCQPTCYAPGSPDPRAGTKLTGASEIQHVVCQKGDAKPVIFDDVATTKLRARAWPSRFPPGHKKGTWQADLEAQLKDDSPQKLPKTDTFVVESNWRDVTDPLTKDALRCVNVAHYTTTLRGKLDACGATGKVACEAAGDPTAHALDVIHFRLAEARQLEATKSSDEACAQAALEALAVSRGLPRWRQYKKLNVRGQWTDAIAFRTRFDGTLGEDALFETAATLGKEAEALYTECARIQGVKTTAEQEQSFHSCF